MSSLYLFFVTGRRKDSQQTCLLRPGERDFYFKVQNDNLWTRRRKEKERRKKGRKEGWARKVSFWFLHDSVTESWKSGTWKCSFSSPLFSPLKSCYTPFRPSFFHLSLLDVFPSCPLSLSFNILIIPSFFFGMCPWRPFQVCELVFFSHRFIPDYFQQHFPSFLPSHHDVFFHYLGVILRRRYPRHSLNTFFCQSSHLKNKPLCLTITLSIERQTFCSFSPGLKNGSFQDLLEVVFLFFWTKKVWREEEWIKWSEEWTVLPTNHFKSLEMKRVRGFFLERRKKKEKMKWEWSRSLL